MSDDESDSPVASATPKAVSLDMAKQHRRNSGLDLEEYLAFKAKGKPIRDESWLIAQEELHLIKRIGDGAMGCVFEGSYKGHQVAVKCLQDQYEEGSQEYIDLMQEINIISRNYKNPSKMHPNIVGFVGVCLQDTNPLLVMELMEGGALSDVVNRKATEAWNNKWRPLKKDMLRWSIHLMQGLVHLHKAGIIHRDIKPHNLMLSGDLHTLKLGDFGNSKNFRVREKGDTQMMTGKTGTLRYMAPEVLIPKQICLCRSPCGNAEACNIQVCLSMYSRVSAGVIVLDVHEPRRKSVPRLLDQIHACAVHLNVSPPYAYNCIVKDSCLSS